MAFTEFFCRSGGSNMNGGALASNAEPTTAAVYSATNGGWNSATGVFTPTSGNPSLTVTVGDFANVFIDGATAPVFIGRVTAVSTTTITVSTTAKGGTAPTTAGTGISINVGGAWKGPNAAVCFPFDFVTAAMVNAGGDECRVNFKNSATYSITAGMTHSLNGPITFQGYTTSPGDLGKATFDGGTTGASYLLLSLSSNAVDRTFLCDLIFQNNGATGNAGGLDGTNDNNRTTVLRVVVNNIRGSGFTSCGLCIECEAYACNKSNTDLMAGFAMGFSGRLIRCISHDNTGNLNNGVYDQSGGGTFVDCIFESNGQHGIYCNNISRAVVLGCDFYNNGGSGFYSQTAPMNLIMESSNFVANGGFGINIATGLTGQGVVTNCGFGSGTAANTSGQTTGISQYLVAGSVTYGSNLTPWVDPANGDFRINLAAAKNAGRGNFMQTAASYAGAIGYPDIGSNQHLDSGGTTGPVARFVSVQRGTPY